MENKSLKKKLIEQITPVEVFVLVIIVLAFMIWGWIGLIASIVFTSLVVITHIVMTDKIR